MAMEFHCVTAFCAVAPVAMSKLKVATIAIRLTPFILSPLSWPLSRPGDVGLRGLESQCHGTPFHVKFESEGKPLIPRKMCAQLRNVGWCGTLSGRGAPMP